jgi:predicted dehydrogenase
MSQNKVAIFGLGRMGKVHLEAALGLGLEIIAVCDIREEIRAELQIFQGT